MERGKTKNIYDDAENYMVKEGKYEGIMLCDVAKMDPNDLIEMARQGSLIEPELQRHAETLVKNITYKAKEEGIMGFRLL